MSRSPTDRSWTLVAGSGVFLAAALLLPGLDVANDLAGMDIHLTATMLGVAAVIAGIRFLEDWRSWLPSRLAPLDWIALAFLAWAGLHLLFLGDPHPHRLKGFLVEIRIVFVYVLARILMLDLAYSRRALDILLVVSLVFGTIGLVDYYLGWGTLLEVLDRTPDSKFWKRGLQRLYAPTITPVSTAYFLGMGLCAAAGRWVDGRRWLPSAGVLMAALTVPLTLTRTAVAWLILFVIGVSVGIRALRTFLLVAIACAGVSFGVTQLQSTPSAVGTYVAQEGVVPRDTSAKIHFSVIGMGVGRIVERPLGYGFGQAGHLAMRADTGAYPANETYFITLGVQAGVPAIGLSILFLAGASGVAYRAAFGNVAARRGPGVFLGGVLFGTLAGSLFLPIAAKAWLQVYLCSVLAALVAEENSST